MPPGRKSVSTSSKSSTSTNGNSSSLDCGTVVWCKYKKYPYWPGIIWEKVTKSSRTSYEVLFFGTFSIGLSIDQKWLEPFEGIAQFKKRLIELKSSEIQIKNKPSQYDMNITLANLESFQEAIRQASKVIKSPNSSERLQLADQMRKGVTCDFFQLDLNDDDDDHFNEFDEPNHPIVFLPQIQNDQEFIETMINHGRRKRKMTDENPNSSNRKLKRLSIKNEPEQPSADPPPSILFRNSIEQPVVMCSNFVCHNLSPTEERFLIDAIVRQGSDCSFFQAKQIAEEMYSTIISVNNSNRSLAVSEFWFYLFFYLHFDELYSTHNHWLNDLEKSRTRVKYLIEQEQQLIRLMKTFAQ